MDKEEERLEAFERMYQNVKERYVDTISKIEKLKGKWKDKECHIQSITG